MKESEKEKHLGDFITKYANPKATIEERKRKGYGILSEITNCVSKTKSKRFIFCKGFLMSHFSIKFVIHV